MALVGSHNVDVQSLGDMQALREWTFPEEDRALNSTINVWRPKKTVTVFAQAIGLQRFRAKVVGG